MSTLSNLVRYKDAAVLFLKYGRSDLFEQAGLGSAIGEFDPPPEGVAQAENLAEDLESLGPTFVKLGQMLASRADLLPKPYLEPLQRLQDSVEPFPYEEVDEIVRQQLGVRISKAFAEFDERPLAAASLGQVHLAKLRDGRKVAVKVQRPNIRQRIVDDLEAIADVAQMLDNHTEAGRRYGFAPMVEEFRRTLMAELDYRREATNLQAMAANLQQFDRIVVPRVIPDFSTAKVLTMQYLSGVRVDDLNPVVRLDMKGDELAEELFRAYLHQILVTGLFHADPHPGNVLLTPEHDLALLDLGMVGHILPSMQLPLLEMLMAIGEGDGEGTAKVALDLAEHRENVDRTKFRAEVNALVSQHQGAELDQIRVGDVVLSVFAIAGNNGLRIPAELSVLGKALLQLDEIGRSLDPKFEPNSAIQRNVGEIMRERAGEETSLRRLFSTMLETKEFVEELPGKVNRILGKLSEEDFSVEVDAIDEEVLIDGFQAVANRISTGLVLAALIVGAALMMDVETGFTLFGYPGIAIVCFLIASVIGLWLVGRILWSEYKSSR